jgi:ParB-like chromosome segregation protein Spo0J
MDIRKVKLAEIGPGPNIRSISGDRIDELAESIRECGLLQPIVVRPWPHKGDDFAF